MKDCIDQNIARIAKKCCPRHSLFKGKNVIVSSEGALYVMMTYYIDIQPLFEDTPVLNNNFEHLFHDVFGD